VDRLAIPVGDQQRSRRFSALAGRARWATTASASDSLSATDPSADRDHSRVAACDPARQSRSPSPFHRLLEASDNAGKQEIKSLRGWRDPDSNRGHHDFQSCCARLRILLFARHLTVSGVAPGPAVFPDFAPVSLGLRPTARAVGLFVAPASALTVTPPGCSLLRAGRARAGRLTRPRRAGLRRRFRRRRDPRAGRAASVGSGCGLGGADDEFPWFDARDLEPVCPGVVRKAVLDFVFAVCAHDRQRAQASALTSRQRSGSPTKPASARSFMNAAWSRRRGCASIPTGDPARSGLSMTAYQLISRARSGSGTRSGVGSCRPVRGSGRGRRRSRP
jgi:hypothetical protein